MRTSKFSEEQIIGFLRQAEAGMPIKEIGRKHGFSDASFYKWRSKFGGMDASEAKRLPAHEGCSDLQFVCSIPDARNPKERLEAMWSTLHKSGRLPRAVYGYR